MACAGKDLGVAFDDVAPSIEALLKLDEGIDCTFRPETSLNEFLAAMRGVAVDGDDCPALHRRFAVHGIHA